MSCLTLFFAAALLPASSASAHFLWLDSQPLPNSAQQIRLYFSEGPKPGEKELIDKVMHTKVWVRDAGGGLHDLALQRGRGADAAALLGTYERRAGVCVEAACEYGVYEHGSQSVWLTYYAKLLPPDWQRLGEKFTRSKRLILDIVPEYRGRSLGVNVFFHDEPAAQREVIVIDPAGARRELKTDSHGHVELPSGAAGRYAVRAKYIEADRGGSRNGRAFQQTWHYCTVSLDVPNRDGQPAEKELRNAVGRQKEILAKVRKTLQPWHPFEDAWAAEATLIFTSTYSHTRLPCINIAPGVLAMPRGHAFAVTSVLKGDVQFKEIVSAGFGTDSERFPQDLVDGRRYAVFLKPSNSTLKRMQEPNVTFVRLADSDDEVVAVIDLSQGKAEAEATRVQATRAGSYQGFKFTPDIWAAMRRAEKIDLELQKQFVPFLQNVALAKGATLGEVRSYLGKPDYHSVTEGEISYSYQFNSGAKAPHGKISGTLKVRFTSGLALSGYEIEFSRCEVEKGTNGITSISWMVLSEDEHKKLGLPFALNNAEAGR